jgi:hypothetical protein
MRAPLIANSSRAILFLIFVCTSPLESSSYLACSRAPGAPARSSHSSVPSVALFSFIYFSPPPPPPSQEIESRRAESESESRERERESVFKR